MAINSLNGLNNLTTRMRISGLGTSGLDTESIVTQLMNVERVPLDKLYQQKQLAQWKSDSYRDVTNLLVGFQNDYFNVLKSASNMKSQSIYMKYASTSSDTSVVTATGSGGVSSLTHKIVVNSIATASNAKSTDTISKSLSGTDITSEVTIDNYNNSFNISYNGVSKTITLANGTYSDAQSIVGNGSDGLLRQKVKEAFNNNVDVTVNGSKIQFTSTNATDVVALTPNTITDSLSQVLQVSGNGQSTDTAITFPLTINQGRRLNVSITEGGVTTSKEIKWGSDTTYNSSIDLANGIQSMLDDPSVFGPGKVTVSGNGDNISFTSGAGVDSVAIKDATNNDKILSYLGFDSGSANKLNLSDTLAQVSNKLSAGNITFTGNKFTLTINGQNIDINDSDTLGTMIDKVNSSDAGVTMGYSSFNDTFTINSKQTGSGSITLNDNGSNFFTATKLTTVNAGTDASFVLDGKVATRTTNTFNIDGLVYTLQKADPGVEKTISLTQDVDSVYNSIKSFVEKYNQILDTINGKLSEDYDRDYQPLTQEQKDAMNETDITNWEKKAKTGLLRNDSVLSKIVGDMRKALYDPINGIAGSLSSIGITTGTYEQKGKLVIDDAKLKDTINSSPDKVMLIFSKESTTRYSPSLTASDKSSRYSDNGIINRLSDILQDNIRTIRDDYGNKGTLLQKAGLVGDSSEFNNMLYDQVDNYNSRIKSLVDKLNDKENAYYTKFSALEKAISKMNSQGSWLSAQLGSK